MSKAKKAIRRYLNTIGKSGLSKAELKSQATDKSAFPEASLDKVYACLRYSGIPKTLQEMDEAIKKGARKQKHLP